MSKATRSSPSPFAPQLRDERGSSDCAFSLEYSTPTPALQLQCPEGQTEVKGPASLWKPPLEEGPRCSGSYPFSSEGAKVQEVCFLSNLPPPPGPPPGLTHGSDPRSGGEGRLLKIPSTLAGLGLPRRGAGRCLAEQLRPSSDPPSCCSATPQSFGLTSGLGVRPRPWRSIPPTLSRGLEGPTP